MVFRCLVSEYISLPCSVRARVSLRYVLVDDDENNPSTPLPSHHADLSEMSASSSSPNPFARVDNDNAAGDATVQGSTATSLAPAVDLFGATSTRGPAARSGAASARNSPAPSPLRSVAPLPTSPGADTTDTGNPFEQALRGRRLTSTASSGTRRVSGDWTDSRTNSSKARKRGEGPSDSVSSYAGGGWLEAAAAVEKAGTAAAGGASVTNVPGRPRSGSLSSSASRVVTTSSFHGTAGRRVSTESGSRKESVSSADSAGSPPSVRTVEFQGSKLQQRQNQQRWRGGGGGGMATSAMEAAAEAAAAKAAARDHPNARTVEERGLAVQAMAERALADLEQQLRPLITRKAPEHPPRYSPRFSTPTSPPSLADARGVRRISLSSPLSALSSPGDYAKSPESPAPQGSGIEQQQRWVAAAPEGSITAPLVAAAILLMERACSRRQSLIGSVQHVRERAAALAVGEASGAVGDGLSTAVFAAAADGVPINGNGGSRSPLSSPPSSPSPFSMTERQRSSVPAAGARGLASQQGTATASPPPHIGGLANLSCCVDFERILGEENDALPQEGALPLAGGDRAAAICSSVLRARGSPDKGKPLSDSGSMIAERSFSGIDQHSGGGEVLHFTGGVEASTIRPTTDTWPAVFEDVAVAEERGREVVGIWETAGGALKDACEELAFEEADHSMVDELAAQ